LAFGFWLLAFGFWLLISLRAVGSTHIVGTGFNPSISKRPFQKRPGISPIKIAFKIDYCAREND
jgi:hypothetical protein